MRFHGLLLPSLLLVAQVLSEKVINGSRNSPYSTADGDPSASLGKAQNKQRGQASKSMTNGKFVTKDHAACRWAVTEQEVGLSLKIECTRADREFSCVFTGDPTGCLQHNKDSVYWKQIAQTLRKQKNICGNSKSVLKTRVCKKKFPESNLKLAKPSGPGNKKPRKEEAEGHREHSKVQESSSMEPNQVKEGISPSPAVTNTMPIKNSECREDPDVVNQRKTALDFCGESWSSFCMFILNMLQATSC